MMSILQDQSHPIWNIVKAVIFFAFVVLFSWTNASDFDKTEINMLIQIGIVLSSGVAVETYLLQTKASRSNTET